MLERILPTDVQLVEAFNDEKLVKLFAEEEAAVAMGVEKRRLEFSTVRRCAREALSKLGIPPTPILPGPQGEPQWPAGVVGSMTHCQCFRAAAVGLNQLIASIGIDAEPNEPLPVGVSATVMSVTERTKLELLPQQNVAWDRVLFSAKESIYKAWFPMTHSWLGFEDVAVALHPDGRFASDLLVATPPNLHLPSDLFDGRWIVHDGLIGTSVVLAASS